MNKKYIIGGMIAALVASAAPMAAQAADWHDGHGRDGHDGRGWHGGHPDAWYFHPHYVGRRYVYAPVPAPVYVQQPYYYQPAPVYYEPAPVVSLSVGR